MTEPLYSEIHWLGTHLPAFDQIADGTYVPPENTPQGAQLLFPLLKQPPEVVNQPTMLSTATHKAGWLKAKETTASSKSGAHFRHYKTGAIHDNINEMHTLMAAITLRSGCSYQRWKKGINIMLETIKGNCDMEKLRIILLFEVDFNQLNKYIGKEMMTQAESTGLPQSNMDPKTGKAQVPKA